MKLQYTDTTMEYRTPTCRYMNLFKAMLMSQFERLPQVEAKATQDFDIEMLYRVRACRAVKAKISAALRNLTELFDDSDPTLRHVTRKLGLIHKQVRLAIAKIKRGEVKPTSTQLANIKAFLIIYDKFKMLKQCVVPMYDPDFTYGY
jgi:hypothetical protein